MANADIKLALVHDWRKVASPQILIGDYFSKWCGGKGEVGKLCAGKAKVVGFSS